MEMQKTIDNSYFDWTREKKPVILSRGIASIAVLQLKGQAANVLKGGARCVWPSGLENVDSRHLTRRVWSR